MKLLEEQRERLQIDDIRTILCIALGEHSRLADDVTADLMHEIFQRAQRFTGADDVVYDENTLTLQHCAVFFGEVQRTDVIRVMMDFTSTSIGFVMYALMPLRATTY